MSEQLILLPEALERIERILRGERIEAEAEEEAAAAGTVPAYYGDRSPADVATLWLGWMQDTTGPVLAFYQAGAIGWSSR